ncbi:DUF2809 domain-containing protein [Isoptericola sp. NEAU-Y5]|uniref:DUF2809 domain-containing protein n=1 Tax=Isoptericola luteus TaxID=2879484 RepID=A0ABS7ZIM0_9MICO|nr:M15 family metallopeptidase [Isoptericola sp. NEAU-Y5]MCA5893454.1 DUF2809 domain-containing protein [Isoptericola sp. NEAU-Y5]
MTSRLPRTPRPTAAVLALVVILAGLGGRAVLPPEVGGPLGDALFTVLVLLLLVLVRPRTSPVVAAGAALVVCAAIELSHLSAVPAQILEAVPEARYVFGTAFGATDLAWYALGAAAGGALLHLVRPRSRAVDLDLRHARVLPGRRRGVRVAVSLVLVGVALAGTAGALVWTVRGEQADLAARTATARTELADSADRVADTTVRTVLTAAVDDAQDVLDGTPLLDVRPGDADPLQVRLDEGVAAVRASRLEFAHTEVGGAREALAPVAERAEVVLAASDELADEGRAVADDVGTTARTALGSAVEALDASGDDALQGAPLEDVEAVAATLLAQLDELGRSTTMLLTAQDTAACPEPDQVWFPEAGRLDDAELAPIPWAPQYLVRADVLDGLVELDRAYLAEFGQHLTVNSAYRSYAQQIDVYNPDDPNPLAAPPGCSNHGLGTAVDLAMGPDGFDSARYRWLTDHAEEHGWHHPDWAGPNGRLPEPWHWESVETPTGYES